MKNLENVTNNYIELGLSADSSGLRAAIEAGYKYGGLTAYTKGYISTSDYGAMAGVKYEF